MSYETPETHRPLKVTYLVLGLLFVGIAGIWLLGAADVVDSDKVALWSPALLILAGAAGLVGSVANNHAARRRGETTTTWVDAEPTEESSTEPTTILEEEHHD